ncbi:MAG: RES family NAD+ phosphorylase [Desulfatitalea sp.]
MTKEKYLSQALTGDGSKLYGARWNPPGTVATYTADSLSLAILELLVHLNNYRNIRSYVAVSIQFDESKVTKWPIKSLPKDWNSLPTSATAQQLGQKWLSSSQSVVLQVPSAVVPKQYNYVVNPLHPDFKSVTIGSPLKDPIDMRLIKNAKKTP